ncbi:hypothetical protein T439DRAFT_322082 [Meredithblackwellia eburnea MCA 4105]
MPLRRNDAVQLLLQCSHPSGRDVEEVLTAFIYSKKKAGKSDNEMKAKFLRLTQYLRIRNGTHLLVDNQETFERLSRELSQLPDALDALEEHQLGTDLGRAAWDEARELSRIRFGRGAQRGGRGNKTHDVRPPPYDPSSSAASSTSQLELVDHADFLASLGDPWMAGGQTNEQEDVDEWDQLPPPPPPYRRAF